MFALVGALLTGGMAVLQGRPLIEPPQDNTDYERYRAEYQAYLRTQQFLTFAGFVLLDLAAFLGILFGVYAAVRGPDLPDGVRWSFVLGPLVLAGFLLLGFLMNLRQSYTFP
jgi:hypothetical protein